MINHTFRISQYFGSCLDINKFTGDNGLFLTFISNSGFDAQAFLQKAYCELEVITKGFFYPVAKIG